MKATAIILVASACLVARSVLGLGAAPEQDPTKQTSRSDRPPRTYKVRIIVAPEKQLRGNCEKQPLLILRTPTASSQRFRRFDVLVSTESVSRPNVANEIRLPFSCVEGHFFKHERSDPEHVETEIQLSRVSQDSITWTSTEPFRVLRIATRTGPPGPYPFERLKVPTEARSSHETGPITSLEADYRTYKVVFEIRGVTVDPDVDCVP